MTSQEILQTVAVDDDQTLLAAGETQLAEGERPRTAPHGADLSQVFTSSEASRLRRFLVMGAETGTVTLSEDKYARRGSARARLQPSALVASMLASGPEGHRAVLEEILSVSLSGAAKSQDPGLMALAQAASVEDPALRAEALAVLPKVARTASTLFTFVSFIEDHQMRGWGKGLRKAVAAWYTTKDDDKLARQMAKYRNRAGFSHADLLRLSHPVGATAGQKALFEWACRGTVTDDLPMVAVATDEVLRNELTTDQVIDVIREYDLDREMVPTQMLTDASVWRALLDGGMPMNALVRNLGAMTSHGVFDGSWGQAYVDLVVKQLGDPAAVSKSRLHPLAVLTAMFVYEEGRGQEGKNVWTPKREILEALDGAFYLAFKNVKPSGKKVVYALDVSGSMFGYTAGNTRIPCAVAGLALILPQLLVDPDAETKYFTRGDGRSWRGDSGIADLALDPAKTVEQNVRQINRLPWGGTDCALPILDALAKNQHVDAFVVVTDNDTWAGRVSPAEALKRYQKAVNPEAKLVVVSMMNHSYSIADPSMPESMLDVAGFDASMPQIIANFLR